MTPITLLLDLDDTLLDSNLPAFLPAYYEALARHLATIVPPAKMLAALRSGVNRMVASRDPARTLQQVFEADFYRQLADREADLRAGITTFYEDVFPGLGYVIRPRPEAAELVDWARSSGHEVALATDPLFPRIATETRVRWAGLEPGSFALISSFEAFHFSKSHPAYFAEVLGQMGWPERTVVMAGNDIARDLEPAQLLGLATFHVNGNQPGVIGPHGDLKRLRKWLDSGQADLPASAFTTREAVLALLEATPAVLHTMTRDLGTDSWLHEPTPDDWAVVEIVCHLRDTEREVHAAQIKSLIDSATPFVARPDAAVWAKQRRYLDEDGPQAVQEFGAARAAALDMVRSLPDETWNKAARHAIFGPTTFLEVLGFMAEHDRLHLRQAWRTLHHEEKGPHRD